MEHWKFNTPFGFGPSDMQSTTINNPDGSIATQIEYSNGLKVKTVQNTDGSVDFSCNKKLDVDPVKKEMVPDMSTDNTQWEGF